MEDKVTMRPVGYDQWEIGRDDGSWMRIELDEGKAEIPKGLPPVWPMFADLARQQPDKWKWVEYRGKGILTRLS